MDDTHIKVIFENCCNAAYGLSICYFVLFLRSKDRGDKTPAKNQTLEISPLKSLSFLGTLLPTYTQLPVLFVMILYGVDRSSFLVLIFANSGRLSLVKRCLLMLYRQKELFIEGEVAVYISYASGRGTVGSRYSYSSPLLFLIFS